MALEVYSKLQFERYGESYDIDQSCWVHVGDDLANDVGASAVLGAKTIWCCLDEEYCQTAMKRFLSKGKATAKEPFWSTASESEVQQRQKLSQDALTFVSAEINTLSQLPQAVSKILRDQEQDIING